MKTLYLIDASSLFFRAFYAIPPLNSPKGFPTNAIYGFLNQLIRLLREKKPDYVVLCLDRKEPSFRVQIYPEYKANRTELPEALAPQLPYIEQLGELVGIKSYSHAGFEADDVIGTLATQAQEHGFEVVIVSGDKDFAQLVNERVRLYDTMKETVMGPKEVEEKWGVRPDQFLDFLALVGDSSDNVPGVAGVGPKGAAKLVHELGGLDQIYAKTDSLKGAMQTKIVNSKEKAYLSRRLVEIHKNVPISWNESDLKLGKASQDRLKSFFEEFNFKSFDRDSRGLPNLDTFAVASQVPPAASIDELPIQESSLDDLEKKLKLHEGAIFGLAVGQPLVWWPGLDRVHSVIDRPGHWLKWLNRNSHRLVTYDLKQFLHEVFRTDRGGAARTNGDSRQMGLFADTSESGTVDFQTLSRLKFGDDLLLLSYLLHAGENLALETLLEKYLGRSGLDSGAAKLSALPQLSAALAIALQAEPESEALQHLFRDVELPLAAILFSMEQTGFRIDRAELKRQSEELGRTLEETERRIHNLAGENFTIGSPKQLAQILFTKLKLPPGHKTKTGFSTDSEVLEGLKTEHPIAAEILEYREVAKLKSTYIDAFPNMLDAHDRLHTNFRQALTTTGRLSSVDPNLQNIPIRTERGARIRKAFVAGPGQMLLSADYSQIELRILAHISEDPSMIQAFKENHDIHSATAAEIFHVDLKQVTADQRRVAKSVNFGIAYGQGAFGLAENLGITRTQAQEIIQNYFAKFPGVKAYIDKTILDTREKGYVATLFGRVRKIPEIRSQSPMVKKAGERAAINAPIQGTAADIVKIAMVQLSQKVESPMISQVHDELIFEASEAQLKRESSTIVEIMESAAQLKVPLKVNWAIGPNWDQAH